MEFNQPTENETLRVALVAAIAAAALVGITNLDKLHVTTPVAQLVFALLLTQLLFNVTFLYLSVRHHRYIWFGKKVPTRLDKRLEIYRQRVFNDQALLFLAAILVALCGELERATLNPVTILVVLFALLTLTRILFLSF